MAMKLRRMKKLKISEIDKSDLIVSVVSQLISFFEQGYQFDCEYWRFEKERIFDYYEMIFVNEKENWIIQMKKIFTTKEKSIGKWSETNDLERLYYN